MDYHRILPALLVGSHPETSEHIDRLKRDVGVSAVLNLQTDTDIQHFRFDWESLLIHYGACGIQLRRVPVRDFDSFDLQDQLRSCVSVLNELLRSGHTVYLHCTAGTGRSPSVAIAYLTLCCGWDFDAAVAHVKQCRPCAPNVEALRLAISRLGSTHG